MKTSFAENYTKKDKKETFSNLGLDSLDTVELVMKVESIYNITIADEEMEKIKSVNDMLSYLMTMPLNQK